MQRIAGHLAFFVLLALWVADVTWASDISCPHTYRPRCDVSAPAGTACADPMRQHAHGSQLICEYAMLHETYEGIYADQQRRRYAGTLRKSDQDAWRKRRDACTTVRCLDLLFADWRRAPQGTATREATMQKPQPMADNRAARRTLPAAPTASRAMQVGDAGMSAVSAPDDQNPPAPVFESVPVSLRDSLQPLPPVSPRAPGRVNNVPAPFAWLGWLSWIVVVMAAGGAFYWLVVRKQATRYLDAAFTSASAGLSWLKTLPTLAFILTGLALLNGVLLVVLLGGWPMHIPGVN